MFLFFTTFKNSDILIPNLFTLFPVAIFLLVLALISGLILTPIFVIFFNFFEISLINVISFVDSAFIDKMFFLIANLISSTVLPTPEKTILFGLIPAFKANFSSPTDTTSAPRLFFLIL